MPAYDENVDPNFNQVENMRTENHESSKAHLTDSVFLTKSEENEGMVCYLMRYRPIGQNKFQSLIEFLIDLGLVICIHTYSQLSEFSRYR